MQVQTEHWRAGTDRLWSLGWPIIALDLFSAYLVALLFVFFVWRYFVSLSRVRAGAYRRRPGIIRPSVLGGPSCGPFLPPSLGIDRRGPRRLGRGQPVFFCCRSLVSCPF